METTTLWSDPTRPRRFLIPDSEKLPSGNFVLRTVTGRQQEVDPEALPPFEVTQEEAKLWLKEQFGQVVATAKGAFLDTLNRGRDRPPDFDPTPGEHSPAAERSRATPASSPGLSWWSALSGETLESLQTDPGSLAIGIRKALDELGAVLEDATAPDESGLESAREPIRMLRARLREQGISVSDKSDEIPDRLRELYYSAEGCKDAEEAAAGLETFAQGLEQAAATGAKQLRTLAQRLRERQSSADQSHRGKGTGS